MLFFKWRTVELYQLFIYLFFINMCRTWREKLEEAERRKREETKELQVMKHFLITVRLQCLMDRWAFSNVSWPFSFFLSSPLSLSVYSLFVQRSGVTFKVDNRLPNLVNLNEDPQLSEMLLYMIKEGETKVGKLKSESAHDIQLSGALIADEHWWDRSHPRSSSSHFIYFVFDLFKRNISG